MFIVYKTVNTINGKFYIGVHCTHKNKENGFYFGSGKALKSALKKYGKENFIRYTLFEFETLQEALEKEKNIVTEEFVNEDNNYNLTVGGSIPPNSKNWWTEEHSALARNRMIGNTHKLGKKESEETRLKKSISMKHSKTIGRWERSKIHKQVVAERSREQMLNNNPMMLS